MYPADWDETELASRNALHLEKVIGSVEQICSRARAGGHVDDYDGNREHGRGHGRDGPRDLQYPRYLRLNDHGRRSPVL